jgi:hypothetical protein
MAAADPFEPSRMIVLSELTAREKERIYTFLVDQDVKFHRDQNGHLISNVRMLGPNCPRLTDEAKVIKVKEQVGFQQRLQRLDNMPPQGISVHFEGIEAIDISAYKTFVGMASLPDDIVRPKRHVLTWVMRLVEDFYDARYT